MTRASDPEAAKRRLWVLAHEHDLDRDERLEFASMLLAAEVESWKDLTAEQVERLLDALDGAHYLDEVKRQRV